MRWLRRLTVSTRLFLGFSIMILLALGIGYAGYRSIRNIQSNFDEVFQVRLPSLDYLIETDRDLQQLLVAERSMIFADVKSDVFRQLTDHYEENLRQSEERWNNYKALSASSEEKALFPKYEQAREEWKGLSRQVVTERLKDTEESRRTAIDLTLGPARENFDKMRNFLDELEQINLNIAEKTHDRSNTVYKRTVKILLIGTGVGLLAGIVLAWIIGRGVTTSLRKVIEGLTESSVQVACASREVASASQSLAEGASEQAAAIEETTSSLEEMASMTQQNAEHAVKADAHMAETKQGVDRASDSMVDLTETIRSISDAGDQIARIVKTIDEIAFQTNLLALNAAVEAARAGEAGSGFAVVADEVRNLAMRAAAAAKNTTDLIEATIGKIQKTSDLVIRTNENFGAVVSSTSVMNRLVGEITAASEEQAQGIRQINQAMTELDKVTQQNVAHAEESAAASEEMDAQAEQMKVFVEQLVTLVGRGESR